MVAQIDRVYLRFRLSKAYSRIVAYVMFEGRPLTTRGRWFNPVVFGFLRVLCLLPAPKKVRAPVFIVGTGRSGTTVLGIVLSMHKQVGYLNEPKALWHSAYGGEDLVGSYSAAKGKYFLTSSDATGDVRRRMHRMYGWYLALSRSSIVVDKYPELVFRPDFVKRIFPDARFIFLVRSGRDTCLSIRDWSQRLGVKEGGVRHDWWGVNRRKWILLLQQVASIDPDLAPMLDRLEGLSRHSDMAAVEWILSMRAGLALSKQLPGAVKTVYYEELVSDPRRVLEEIRLYCGLSEDEVFSSYGAAVLRPAKRTQVLALDPVINDLYHRTMEELGYSCT